MQAPAGAGGIRQLLLKVIVSAVALVLALVVISLSVGSSLPGASLRAYLTTGARGGSENDATADFLLSTRVFQGDQEPLPGTVNSSEASLRTREDDRNMPVPVATGDTDTTPKLDEGTTLDSSKSSSTCDLYRGEWFFDSSGPLYTNNSCPLITKTQNCQANGRPDKGYENWRWKPEKCILPRFDARKFLELMRGKTLAFVGDSVARNQMESLLCILWQSLEDSSEGSTTPDNALDLKRQGHTTRTVRVWLPANFTEKN
ncbi:hypothetical protein QYE76_051507 [Lolium multiflorum]|uniref:Trichome birefringence-like N-terminal domain-containing protein n=1 Tax=Lolium multiflorum TaxID=4521 RepID=A0AAD8VXB3_LOLMU|nr:hypothetical protein QYE76_025755 [Lolium multiflorum]KAK1663348.1 hypothetical protein QYE76_051507 [Lolium multiflorum]